MKPNLFIKTMLVKIFFLFAIILNAQEIGKAWEFNEDGNFEGFTLSSNFKDSVVEGGYLKATVAKLFPALWSEEFELDAADFGYIQIRLKIPGASSGKIMWNNDSGAWGYSQFYCNGDSAFHAYELPVYLSSQWVGKITKIMRLDFNPEVGSKVEIDYIRIVRLGTKPTIKNFTPIRTIIKPNEEIPLFAIVKNEGDIEAHLQSKLILPGNALLIDGILENDHGALFKELTDSINWTIKFSELGEYDLTLKLFTESDTTEKVINVNVTDQFWDQKKFLLSAWSPPYAWYGPPYEDTVFTYYKNANFDNALWIRDDDALMQKVKEHDLKYFLLVTPIIGELYLRAPDKETPPDVTEEMLLQLETVINKYKDDPDLLGYHICDEPHRQAFPNIGKVVGRIRKLDPTRLSFVNIWPSGQGYREYIDDLLQTTKLELLSYDRYHFFNGYDGGEYFSNLSIIRQYALKYDIPFCNIIQGIGTNGTVEEDLNWRTPNTAEHRWLVYSSLTYGVHALIWFHWHGNWGLTGNPDREIIYPSIQSINEEIDSLSQIMVKLKTVGAYHTITNEDKWQLPPKGIVKSVSVDADLVVGYFKDKSEKDYFMLMNKDYHQNLSTEVILNYVLDTLQFFNVVSDSWEDLNFVNGDNGAVFELSLRAGAGKLFRFKGETIVSVSKKDELPAQFKLFQNYPNPFNPSTTIKYTIPSVISNQSETNGERSQKISHSTGGQIRNNNVHVGLKVYDVLGREVATLVNKQQKAGNYEVQFNASSVGRWISSGVYFYQLQATSGSGQAGNFVKSRKMMLVK